MGTGYGIRDQQWKYNAYGLWRLHRGWHTHLRLNVQRDLLEPGAPYEMNTNTLINRSLYAQRMDISREAALRFSSRIGRVIHASVTLRHQEMTPAAYIYSYQQAEQTARTSRFTFDEVTVFGRWAYGEQLRRFLGNNTTVQRWPVVELAATHSIRGYQYQRYLAAVYQSIFIPRLGYCQWRLEAGWANGDLPLAKLFTLNQNTGNYSVFAVSQTFQALPDTLFLHNRFANLFFEQELGPVFYQKKYSAPTLSLLQNIAIGQLKHPERHKNIGFLTMQQPYVETGIRLDNLLRINYVNFGWIGVGGAVFYRWGAWSNTHWCKNITPRLSVKFTL